MERKKGGGTPIASDWPRLWMMVEGQSRLAWAGHGQLDEGLDWM